MNNNFKKLTKKGIIGRRKPMDLISLISRLKTNNFTNLDSSYPEKIGDFTFVKELKKVGSKKDFSICLYNNGQGKKVFAKLWTGRKKDFKYNTLLNEIRAYYILNDVQKRIRDNKEFRKLKVRIPKILDVYESTDQMIVFLSFEKGKPATNETIPVKVDSYIRTVKYLEILGANMRTNEKKVFSKRNVSSYMLLYPLLFIRSAINFPKHITVLLKGAPLVIKAFYHLSKGAHIVLAHRDLHFNNLLIDKKTIVLVDLQYMVFTEVIYEFVTTLRYRWGIDGFEYVFLGEANKFFESRKNYVAIFEGLLANSVTHGLTDNTFQKDKILRWVNLLNTITSGLSRAKGVILQTK